MMPTYYVNLDDESTYPDYRWDEEIISTEVFPIFDNRVHTQEQSSGLLDHSRIKIVTTYTYKPGSSVNPYVAPLTLDQFNAFNAALIDRKKASHYHSPVSAQQVKSSSPNGPKKMKVKKKTSFMSCPPGFRYDFKTKSCVKIKGRNKYAIKKKFRNNKRR